MGKKPDDAVRAAQLAFRSELASVDGVLAVLRCDVTYERATRTLHVVWQVSTGLGNTQPDTLAHNIGGAL